MTAPTADTIQPHHATLAAVTLYEQHGSTFARGLRDALGRLLLLEGDSDPSLLPLLEGLRRRAGQFPFPDGPIADADADDFATLLESEDAFDADRDWELEEEQAAHDASLMEAAGAGGGSARKQGEVWQGASGRWFTLNKNNRVVPAKNPNAQPKEKKPRQTRQDAQDGTQATQPTQSQPGEQNATDAKPGRKAGVRPAPKAERPSVESLKARLAEIMAGGDARGFADELMKLSKDQIRQVRDKLGSKIGKTKEDLARNLADAAVKKAREVAPARPEPEPEPPPPYSPRVSTPRASSGKFRPANKDLPDGSRVYLADRDLAAGVEHYQSSGYHGLNQALWSSVAPSGDHAATHARLRAAFAKTPEFAEPVTVYRGPSLLGPQERRVIAQMEELAKSGEPYEHAGYASASTGKIVGEGETEGSVYDRPLQFVIKARKGLDVTPVADDEHATERELLLPAGAKYRVGKVERRGRKTYVHMEQLPEGGGEAGGGGDVIDLSQYPNLDDPDEAADVPGTPEHFRNYLSKTPAKLPHQQDAVRRGYERVHGVKVPDDWRTAGLGGGQKKAEEKPAAPAEAAADTSPIADAVARHAVAILSDPANRVGVVKVPDLVDRVLKDHPGMSRGQAHAELQRMQADDMLTLQLVNDPRLEPRASEMIQTPRGLRGYVSLRPETPVSAPAPEPKVAPKAAEPKSVEKPPADAGTLPEVPPATKSAVRDAIGSAPVASVADLRKALAGKLSGKDFDAAVLRMADDGDLIVSQDAAPEAYGPEREHEVIRDGGNVLTTVSLRGAAAGAPAAPATPKPRPKPPINFGDVNLAAEDDDEDAARPRRTAGPASDETDKERRIRAHAERVAKEDPDGDDEGGDEPVTKPKPPAKKKEPAAAAPRTHGEAARRILAAAEGFSRMSKAELDDFVTGLDLGSMPHAELKQLARRYGVGTAHEELRSSDPGYLAAVVRGGVRLAHDAAFGEGGEQIDWPEDPALDVEPVRRPAAPKPAPKPTEKPAAPLAPHVAKAAGSVRDLRDRAYRMGREGVERELAGLNLHAMSAADLESLGRALKIDVATWKRKGKAGLIDGIERVPLEVNAMRVQAAD